MLQISCGDVESIVCGYEDVIQISCGDVKSIVCGYEVIRISWGDAVPRVLEQYVGAARRTSNMAGGADANTSHDGHNNHTYHGTFRAT